MLNKFWAISKVLKELTCDLPIKDSCDNLIKFFFKRNSIKYNKDLVRRQVEINEWYYQDKLETLFFMQIFFMSMLSMCIVFYFRKTSLITSRFAGYLTLILFLIVALTCFYRYFYTSQLRDSRWWYKRRFAKPIYIEENKCGCVDDPFLPKKDPCPAKVGVGKCLSGMQGATSVAQVVRERGILSAVGTLLEKDVRREATPSDVLNRTQEQLNSQAQSSLKGDLPDTSSSSCNKGTEIYNSKWFSSKPLVGEPGSSNVALNKNILPYIGIPSSNKTKTMSSYLLGDNTYV
jgi:hypothetical protein